MGWGVVVGGVGVVLVELIMFFEVVVLLLVVC